MAAQGATASRSGLRSALPLLAPAYLWLTVAIFLPLSAMVFFSFMTDLPLSGKPWAFTLGNYAAFFSQSLYLTLLLASLRLGLEVTLWCVVIGYPAAYVLAKVLKGRSREAIFSSSSCPSGRTGWCASSLGRWFCAKAASSTRRSTRCCHSRSTSI